MVIVFRVRSLFEDGGLSPLWSMPRIYVSRFGNKMFSFPDFTLDALWPSFYKVRKINVSFKFTISRTRILQSHHKQKAKELAIVF